MGFLKQYLGVWLGLVVVFIIGGISVMAFQAHSQATHVITAADIENDKKLAMASEFGAALQLYQNKGNASNIDKNQFYPTDATKSKLFFDMINKGKIVQSDAQQLSPTQIGTAAILIEQNKQQNEQSQANLGADTNTYNEVNSVYQRHFEDKNIDTTKYSPALMAEVLRKDAIKDGDGDYAKLITSQQVANLIFHGPHDSNENLEMYLQDHALKYKAFLQSGVINKYSHQAERTEHFKDAVQENPKVPKNMLIFGTLNGSNIVSKADLHLAFVKFQELIVNDLVNNGKFDKQAAQRYANNQAPFEDMNTSNN